MKLFRANIIAIVVGLVILLLIPVTDQTAVTCEGEPMKPGDRCLNIDDGGSQGYEEVKAANDNVNLLKNIVLGGFGAFVIGGSILGMVKKQKQAAREAVRA